MSIIIKEITENEFHLVEYPIIFSDGHSDRKFGLISNGKYSYKFAWRSDLISPVIVELTTWIYCLGIDQNFVIINFKSNAILLDLKLTYFFYDIKINGNFIYVITELEIIKIAKTTFIVEKIYDLPDMFQEIEFNNQEAKIKCFGDNIVFIE
jgi:hypothetical protein